MCYAFGCDGKMLEGCSQESDIIRCVSLVRRFRNWRLFLWLHRIVQPFNPPIIFHSTQSLLASFPFLFRLNPRGFFQKEITYDIYCEMVEQEEAKRSFLCLHRTLQPLTLWLHSILSIPYWPHSLSYTAQILTLTISNIIFILHITLLPLCT